MNKKEKKLPRYFGVRIPQNKKKLDDGTIVYITYVLSNGPCLIIDNHWDTVMPSRKVLRLAFRVKAAVDEELIKEAFRSQCGRLYPIKINSFELGDMVWILFADYQELVLQRVAVIGYGIRDFDNGVIYKCDNILLIQCKISYNLIDEEWFNIIKKCCLKA